MRYRHFLRAAAAGILSAVMIAGPAAGAQTIDPEEIVTDVLDQIGEAAQKLDMPEFEGNVTVTAQDGMRDAIAEHYRSQEDMSWIQDAAILLQGCSNEEGGSDLEATFEFNDTELYHLQVSYDKEGNKIYLICPELKDQVIEFPIDEFVSDPYAWTRKKLTAQMAAEGMSLIQELSALVSSISLETLQAEVLRYYTALQPYIQVKSGFTTVQAGTLTAEGATTVLSISAENVRQLIPEALTMLSQDELVMQILESDFAEHVFSLVMKSTAGGIELPKGTLRQLVQQFLTNAAKKSYDKMNGVTLTIAFDKKNVPIQLAATMESKGMSVELFQINAVLDGGHHAFEIKAGPVLARKLGIRSTLSSGILIQGSLDHPYLIETVSLNTNGDVRPLFKIVDLDLTSFRKIWPLGTFQLYWNDVEYSCEFYIDENGLRTMQFRVNDEDWFVLTAQMKEVESTDLDEMDRSDPFVVDSRTAFEEYMRDASALNMFEKLAGAGVPQEYVDMLTDGEAATESSRENTVELNN